MVILKELTGRPFERHFFAEIDRIAWSVSDRRQVEDRASQITEAFRSARKTAIPRKKTFKTSVLWWNERLTRLKRGVNRARKRFQRQEDNEIRNDLTCDIYVLYMSQKDFRSDSRQESESKRICL